jgi:hypothetical protein
MNTLTLDPTARNDTAKTFHASLAAIDLANVPVLSRDRSIPRKEQAKLARALFRQLGLEGISVTTPTHSMANSVELRLPTRNDYTPEMLEFGCAIAGNPVTAANGLANRQMSALMDQAFPEHKDRSEMQSDYFDYRWSITT